ncbi:MAG TPA: Gfo/Idh/MocA family oxidoreductase [Jiangellaceae bacterium]
MRIGIVGLGDIARKLYLPLLLNWPDIEVAGVMSRSPENVAQVGRQHRIRGLFTDLDDLLAARPDLVFIHAATAAHYELVSACLTAGSSVYVDKPLASNLSDCDDLVRRAERAGLLLAVGFNRRFAPMYVRAREWLTGGLQFAVMEKHRAALHDQTPRQAVFDDLIHVLDTMSWLLGDGAALEASDVRLDRSGFFTLATGLLGTSTAIGSYAMARAVGADSERLALHGPGRSAEVVDLERGELSDQANGRRVITFGSWDTVAERRGFNALIQHVLATVDRPDHCEVGAGRVLATHRLAEDIVQAASHD